MTARRTLAGLFLFLLAGAAQAHRPSDAFLTLRLDGPRLAGHWEIALRDLEALTGVDADGDRAITWGELRGALPVLQRTIPTALRLESDAQPCPVRITDLLVRERLDGPYAWLTLEAECAAPPATITVMYRLLFDVDPTHRGILVLTAPGVTHSAVFAPGHDTVVLSLAGAAPLRQFLDYLREGARHIWIGLDHVLFLVALLLPCVLVREGGHWRASDRFGLTLWEVVRVVTAFTLAHSVTLSLSTLDLLQLPPTQIEPLIALSVVLAALNNLRPVFIGARWTMALGFGLLHGCGFAAVLSELGLPPGARLLSLLGFNLGVEIGQLAIVLAAVPPAFALRHTAFYRRAVLTGGSLTVAAIAAAWVGQRTGLLAS